MGLELRRVPKIAGSGTIEYEELLTVLKRTVLNRDPKNAILSVFRLFADDPTGNSSYTNLKRVAQELVGAANGRGTTEDD